MALINIEYIIKRAWEEQQEHAIQFAVGVAMSQICPKCRKSSEEKCPQRCFILEDNVKRFFPAAWRILAEQN